MAIADSDRRPLVLFQTAPYEGSLGRSALDLALSLAVFAQKPSLAFCGDAVLSLKAAQDADSVGRKSLRKVIDSLPLYDIDSIFADSTALETNGLTARDLPDFTIIVSQDELRTLMQEARHVISL